MSRTLYYRYVVSDQEDSLPDELRDVLLKEGTTGEQLAAGRTVAFGNSRVRKRWLKGLQDAGVDGAQDLIEELGVTGAVELWLE